MLIVILFFALINILIASSSAKWTLLAPIFVPMFMLLGYEPQIVQAAYRIGDSTTRHHPLLAYFTILLGLRSSMIRTPTSVLCWVCSYPIRSFTD
jgi:aminobenzoyl-glutamate transport protein